MNPVTVTLTVPEGLALSDILGVCDEHLRLIESTLSCHILVHERTIEFKGETRAVSRAHDIFATLIAMVQAGETPARHDIVRLLETRATSLAEKPAPDALSLQITTPTKVVRPKTPGQRRYVEALLSHTITFGMGPAGTGKTYLAMAVALEALRKRQVKRIILTRPVVEAGESLGFLPGTLEEKLDPYLRPLFDALMEFAGPLKTQEYLEQGIVEIAPLAFMRGRTFSDAFVVLDEAQNTTPAQMKLFLTRLGFGSQFVITGDTSQTDLPGMSGLVDAERCLNELEDIAFVHVSNEDIVRHSLVSKIVAAYGARTSSDERS